MAQASQPGEKPLTAETAEIAEKKTVRILGVLCALGGEMAHFFRRARGVLLRLVRRRPIAVVVGVAVAGPAAWLELSGRYDAWWIDGLSLILAATGLALIWTGVFGSTPDWIDSKRE